MDVTFSLHTPPQPADSRFPPDPVEYVCITGHDGSDAVHRAATDADRERFSAAYRAFKTPPASAPPSAPVAEAAPPEEHAVAVAELEAKPEREMEPETPAPHSRRRK